MIEPRRPNTRVGPGLWAGPVGREQTVDVRAVAILAITGLIALVVAVLTGSTPLAVLVIGLAVAGIVVLLRDWRDDRGHPAGAGTVLVADEPGASPHELSPDEFSPDISSDPGGPSSDARAD